LNWDTSKFGAVTHYITEYNKLHAAKVPVHCFFVDKDAQTCFTDIANQTGGKCQFLDINSAKGADMLTDVVTTQILGNIGQRAGKGDALIKAYEKKYPKSYT